MISDLGRLARRHDELSEEIHALCSRLGELTQERFVIATAIHEMTSKEELTYGREMGSCRTSWFSQ